MLTAVVQAVADALNGGNFSLPFTAVRVAVPQFRLSDMDTLHVTVVPRETEIELLSRAQDAHEVQVDVAVQRRVADLTNETIDSLLALVQEIADYLNRRPMGDAVWRKTVNSPVYSPEHLREMRQFTSVLTLTYRIIR